MLNLFKTRCVSLTEMQYLQIELSEKGTNAVLSVRIRQMNQLIGYRKECRACLKAFSGCSCMNPCNQK